MLSLPRLRRSLAALAAAPLVLSLAACNSDDGGGGDSGSGSASGVDEGGSWTVLHYSVADNSLEEDMSADVNEFGTVGSTGDLQVREYMDRSQEYGDAPVLDEGAWVGARVFDVNDDGTTDLVDDLGDTDSSDPQTLADFIAQGFTDHPADHYALVLSDHGGQWNGIGEDDSFGGNLMSIQGVADGIAAGLEGAGIDKLDLLGFDACMMSGYEVATAMAPYADLMVASQEEEPGHGWDYTAFSAAADGASPIDLGKAIIDGFESQSEEAGDVDGVTLSLLDLTQMDALDSAVADFSSALADDPEAAPAVGRAQADVIGFGKSPDPAQDFDLTDLGGLAAQVGDQAPNVADQAGAVTAALDDVVLDQFNGAALADATGLSIYLPPSVDYYVADYQSEFGGPWDDYLDAYYGIADAVPQSATAAWTQDEPDAELGDDGVTLAATYDPAAQDNLTEATISYGVYEQDDTVTYLGEESADLGTADDPTAVGTFDFTALQLSDGEDTEYAYTDLSVDPDTGLVTVDVPLSYYAPDDTRFRNPVEVSLSLVIDPDSGDVSASYYAVDPDTGAAGEAALDPNGLIFPQLPNYDSNGNETWYDSSDTGLYADIDSLGYDFVPLDSGTDLQMDLGLYDFTGNAAYVSTEVVVP